MIYLMTTPRERKQYVVVNGQSSDHMEVKYGVPQGSLLGTRLFAVQVTFRMYPAKEH